MAVATTVKGQPHHNFTMSLQEVIETAHSQSPSAILARHNFIVNYWQFRTYKAQFLPSLNLQGSLGNYNRSLVSLQDAQTGEIGKNLAIRRYLVNIYPVYQITYISI